MKKTFAVFFIALTMTGCATTTLLDGLLGRYHNYDPVEYAKTVDVVIKARVLEPTCSDQISFRQQLAELDQSVQELRAYAEGRPYNTRTVTLADAVSNIVKDTKSKEQISQFFCRERSKNIVKAAEILRTASGEKPE